LSLSLVAIAFCLLAIITLSFVAITPCYRLLPPLLSLLAIITLSLLAIASCYRFLLSLLGYRFLAIAAIASYHCYAIASCHCYAVAS